ncbi:glycosyltransferase family 4 protein [Mannheimia indoligenes]|uniref:glycosyltransferase family 4 protein n=1 Tax=Mannheimia indoligenes TaxID=3103145 RepID=UPI002FE5E465
MKNNISIAINKFRNGGGTERYILDLVNGFYCMGISPRVYAMMIDKNISEYKKINPFRVNLSLIPKPFKTLLFSHFIQRKKRENEIILSMAYTKADVLFCGGQHIGYLNSTNTSPTLSDRIKIITEKKALDGSKIIIAHSNLMKKELIKFYHIPESKIEVIYPPLDIKKFNIVNVDRRAELRKKFGFNDNEVIYLFPSTGHKRKGFDLLAKYFKHSDLPIKLVVAGTPVKEERNIISLGFRKDIPELYQATDFTIMASSYEPFGLVGLESIFSGTPIVFSENMACSEVLKGNFGYLFDRNNSKSLDDTINSSFKNKFRIDNPNSLLKYNPTLEEHIDRLIKIIDCIK